MFGCCPQPDRAGLAITIVLEIIYEIMSRKEIATEAEWREMAAEAKELRDRLGKLIMMSAKFMPKSTGAHLHRSQNSLDQWRSCAESEMFKRGGPKDISIFYQN